jgi:hypothetical protein
MRGFLPKKGGVLMRYKHPYTATGFAVDMQASRDDIITRFGVDPAEFWAARMKVLDIIKESSEVLVYSTDDPERYRVTCVEHR